MSSEHCSLLLNFKGERRLFLIQISTKYSKPQWCGKDRLCYQSKCTSLGELRGGGGWIFGPYLESSQKMEWGRVNFRTDIYYQLLLMNAEELFHIFPEIELFLLFHMGAIWTYFQLVWVVHFIISSPCCKGRYQSNLGLSFLETILNVDEWHHGID